MLEEAHRRQVEEVAALAAAEQREAEWQAQVQQQLARAQERQAQQLAQRQRAQVRACLCGCSVGLCGLCGALWGSCVCALWGSVGQRLQQRVQPAWPQLGCDGPAVRWCWWVFEQGGGGRLRSSLLIPPKPRGTPSCLRTTTLPHRRVRFWGTQPPAAFSPIHAVWAPAGSACSHAAPAPCLPCARAGRAPTSQRLRIGSGGPGCLDFVTVHGHGQERSGRAARCGERGES